MKTVLTWVLKIIDPIFNRWCHTSFFVANKKEIDEVKFLLVAAADLLAKASYFKLEKEIKEFYDDLERQRQELESDLFAKVAEDSIPQA